MLQKIIISSICAFIAISLSACGAKSPAKVSGEQITINNALLEKHYNFVPKDPYLSTQNYAYSMVLTPNDKYLIENDLIVKTFLLAHSSQKITLIGKKTSIRKYKDYFLENGVNAEIYLQPVEAKSTQNNFLSNELDTNLKDSVQVIFLNKRREK